MLIRVFISHATAQYFDARRKAIACCRIAILVVHGADETGEPFADTGTIEEFNICVTAVLPIVLQYSLQ